MSLFAMFTMVTGGALALSGFLMKRYPPEKPNIIYGYRTKRSMESQEKWDKAQAYSAKLLQRFGTLLFLTNLIAPLLHLVRWQQLILGFILLFLAIGAIIYLTEKKLMRLEDRQ